MPVTIYRTCSLQSYYLVSSSIAEYIHDNFKSSFSTKEFGNVAPLEFLCFELCVTQSSCSITKCDHDCNRGRPHDTGTNHNTGTEHNCFFLAFVIAVSLCELGPRAIINQRWT